MYFQRLILSIGKRCEVYGHVLYQSIGFCSVNIQIKREVVFFANTTHQIDAIYLSYQEKH
ncbi:hypothetical protein VPR01S_01_01280 [Vibrio proteolyticus NBRC 13287]|uniref:Uncharacterized protein n=1 Tax=Vibrio proteolyticus NBRC 13287 TaxID=1219065 RepID=U2ZVA8_VIBPR|nr:hypothetical protein VPR01S_01_01280 [Vibrio proteolyticus NBRC 13287]